MSIAMSFVQNWSGLEWTRLEWTRLEWTLRRCRRRPGTGDALRRLSFALQRKLNRSLNA